MSDRSRKIRPCEFLLTDDGQLALVDYDGMYVEGLLIPPNEAGHPDYQHPERTRAHYGLGMDDFSGWGKPYIHLSSNGGPSSRPMVLHRR